MELNIEQIIRFLPDWYVDNTYKWFLDGQVTGSEVIDAISWLFLNVLGL